MIKTGILTDAYFGIDDYEDGLRKIKAHGYDCIDFRGLSSEDAALFKFSENDLEKYLKTVAECAAKNGLEIYQMHGLWPTCGDTTEEGRAESLVYFKKEMDCAVWLGCPRLVIHPRMAYGWKGGTREQMFEDNVNFLKELLPYAQETGVTLCLENMPFGKEIAFSTAQELKDVITEINDPLVKICLDTGHHNAAGEDLYETIVLFGEDLAALHVHDDRYGQDRHLIPFQGFIDWDKFVQGLKAISFNGCISLETGIQLKTPEPMREQLQVAQAGIARWFAEQIEK